MEVYVLCESNVFKSFCNPKKRNSGLFKEMFIENLCRMLQLIEVTQLAAILSARVTVVGATSGLGKPQRHWEIALERSKDW